MAAVSPSVSGPALSRSVVSDLVSRTPLSAGVPAVMARDLVLPLHPVLAPVFGAAITSTTAGLVRGHTVECSGSGAMSLALAMVASASRAGSWTAVVGLPDCGAMAAAELGVDLERTVFIGQPDEGDVAVVLSAVADGFDLLVVAARTIARLSAGATRGLQTRLRGRGILLTVGRCTSLAVDHRLRVVESQWDGVGVGHGHLRRRRVVIDSESRRRGAPSRHEFWLPGASGAPEEIAAAPRRELRLVTGA